MIFRIAGLLSRTECCQLLLLCTACLVNLVRELELEKREDDTSAAKSDIVEVFTKNRTVERLLDAVKRRGPNISVFLQVGIIHILLKNDYYNLKIIKILGFLKPRNDFVFVNQRAVVIQFEFKQ